MKRWGLLVSIIACATCGDDESNRGHLADAPPLADGATPIDGAVGELQPVTVVVSVQGQPRKDVQVYFQNADSTVVADAKTGDDGQAHAVMQAGGFATVIEPPVSQEGSGNDNGPTEIATFAGVKPGDVLRDDILPVTAATQVSVNISVANEGLNHNYYAFTTCHATSFEGGIFVGTGTAVEAQPQLIAGRKPLAVARAPVEVDDVQLTSCGGTADILVVAKDSDNQLTGWQYKSAVAITAGMTIAFDGAYQAPVDTQFNYTKLPDSISGFDVSRELHTARGTLYISDPQSADASDGSASTTIAMPAPAGVAMATTSVEQPTTGAGRSTVVDWGAALPTYNLAYSDVALSLFTTDPVLDVDAHAMTWSEQARGSADFVIARYGASRPGANDTTISWRWRITAPYTPGKVVFPVLPTAGFDYNLKADDGSFIGRLTTARLPGGYDVARASALDTSQNQYNQPPATVIGPAGQTIYQDWYARARAAAGVHRPAGNRRAAAPKRLSPASH